MVGRFKQEPSSISDLHVSSLFDHGGSGGGGNGSGSGGVAVVVVVSIDSTHVGWDPCD